MGWKITGLVFLLVMLNTSLRSQENDMQNAFQKIRVIPEKYSLLPFSSIRPAGWLKRQLEENMKGFVGHLDSVVPDLIVNDDIYGNNRLTRKVRNKQLGALSDGGDTQVQFLWWNSETQSNWWDGYIRTAILLNDRSALDKARCYVEKILSTQDEDGYLGIYDKELRYRFDNENGELWSKASLLRGLLAWYDFTKDKKVIDAIVRAVDNVMTHYPAGRSQPFYSTDPNVSGLSHGLVFTDILERLYQLTGRELYLDYAAFLYRDFSRQQLNEDAQLPKLMDATIDLKGHGVHTYEHFRSLVASYQATGNEILADAIKRFELKIESTRLPSGGVVGDEWIGGRKADATVTGYEYCSLHEIMHGYGSMLHKTGKPVYGERAEEIFYNAAQGARHPDGSSICYLKTDNSYQLDGGRNGDRSDKLQTRYRYSPAHREAAVCCVPNAGRMGPYFIQHMWMQDGEGIAAMLHGPSELKWIYKGVEVDVRTTTEYPYSNSIRYELSPAAPLRFALKIRVPSWASGVHCSGPYQLINGMLVIEQEWKGRQVIEVSFQTDIRVIKKDDEHYFSYGALVLARPISAKPEVTRVFPSGGLKEINYSPVSLSILKYKDAAVSKDGKSLRFITELADDKGAPVKVELVPMSNTILRQVSFKKQGL